MDSHHLSLTFHSQEISIFDEKDPQKVLAITRTSPPQVSVKTNLETGMTIGRSYPGKISAIVGFIDLLSGPHLIVALRSAVGASNTTAERYLAQCGPHESLGIDAFGQKIYEIRYVDLIQILPDSSKDKLTLEQKNYETQFKGLMCDLLSFGFFFSYTFDITNSISRQFNSSRLLAPWDWTHLDDRFVWNKKHVEPLMSNVDTFGRWVVPIICGSVLSGTNITINNKKCNFLLISRKNKHRSGTRFNSRGIDSQGHVSNFVETEQIVSFSEPELLYSFVQTRGSIPVFWTQQKENFKWEPKIAVEAEDHRDAFKKHFQEQFQLYNDQIILDLVKKTGSESLLGNAYKEQVKQLGSSRLRYIDFDVHHHCGNTKFENLSLLFDQINSDISQGGAFVKRGNTVDGQTTTFRTNCKDCLDRTNLIQGAVAKQNLLFSMKKYGIIEKDEELLNDENFMSFFRNIWADNGDMISILYAGTPALKSDVTRKGKSTLNQLKNDSINAVNRYYLNSFRDGERQDAMDLFLGKYDVQTLIIEREEPVNSIFYFFASLLAFFLFLGPSHGSLMKLWHPIFIAIGIAVIFVFALILRITPSQIINQGVNKKPKKKQI